MVLGEGVSEVVFSRAKIDKKLDLVDTITKPVPSHVHGVGPLLLHDAIEKTIGSGVVNLEGGGACECPNSLRVVTIGTASWQFK
jgi:hypothetical protein